LGEAGATPVVSVTSEPAEAAGSQTLRAQVRLRDLILAGELQPGERITEQALVERLGVSRTPIRTALMRLAEEGLLAPLPAGGYTVQAFSEAEIYDAIEIRGTLEGIAARFAAERGVSRVRIDALNAVLDRIDVALAGELTTESFTAYIELNAYFHALVSEAAESELLARQIQRVGSLSFASPSAFVMIQGQLPTGRDSFVIAQAQHRAVVDAIVDREGARAEALMREHARIAHGNLRNALRDQQTLARIPGASLIRRRT
jgi:GntR family transcriptional regulator, vanillate catabolism transcriptional regulator